MTHAERVVARENFNAAVRKAKLKFLNNIFGAKREKLERAFNPIELNSICYKCTAEKDNKAQSGGVASGEDCESCGKPNYNSCDHFPDPDPFGDVFAFDVSRGAISPIPEKAFIPQYPRPRPPKRNMDVFTTQAKAAEKASVLAESIVANDHAAIIAYLDGIKEAKECLILEDGVVDYPDSVDEYLKIRIFCIGTSVAGLTFHATFHSILNQLTEDEAHKFDELFSFNFVDINLRPVERLRQAHNRTIVPRYEYERLFSTPVKALPKGKRSDTNSRFIKQPRFLHVLLAKAEAKPIDDEAVAALKDEINRYWTQLHKDMPVELRWNPGPARSVAKQIALGHKAWFEQNARANLPTGGVPSYKSIMVNLGYLCKGIQPYDVMESPRADHLSHLFNCKLSFYQAPPNKIRSQTADKPLLGCDLYLDATGLGLDIPGDHVDEVTLRETSDCCCVDVQREDKTTYKRERPIFDFPSVQRSYWDPVKTELDVSEGNATILFVVGNGDAAAGAIFSAFMRDPNACTFTVLSKLLWRCKSNGSLTKVQKWFAQIQDSVNAECGSDDCKCDEAPAKEETITERWLRRFHCEEVQHHLYEGGTAVTNSVQKYSRTGRRIALGLMRDDMDNKIWAHYEERYRKGPKGTVAKPGRLFLGEKLMADAWPENRMLVALYRSYLRYYLMDYSKGDEVDFEITRTSNRLKSLFELEGSLAQVEFSDNRTDENATANVTAKYVVNSAGGPYVQLGGNLIIHRSEDA